jgi:hypothetical protein
MSTVLEVNTTQYFGSLRIILSSSLRAFWRYLDALVSALTMTMHKMPLLRWLKSKLGSLRQVLQFLISIFFITNFGIGCRWLLVLDNADDSEKILSAWPSGAVGSVLLTSRDAAAWFGTVAESCRVQPFDEEAGVSAFLSLIGRGTYTESERTAAEKIMQSLGGLPLAINQISGFIVQQRLALEDFLPLYERNSTKINAKKTTRGDYEHTLSTVWELSLSQLSGPSRTLQTILAFLDPDKVHESVLREGSERIQEGDFEFLGDDME